MIKSLIVAALMLIASNAIAHGSSHPQHITAEGQYVAKDQAVGVIVANRYNYDRTGRMLFCPSYAEYRWDRPTICTINGQNAWALAENFVPVGRTFIGFQLIYARDWYVALYYK